MIILNVISSCASPALVYLGGGEKGRIQRVVEQGAVTRAAGGRTPQGARGAPHISASSPPSEGRGQTEVAWPQGGSSGSQGPGGERQKRAGEARAASRAAEGSRRGAAAGSPLPPISLPATLSRARRVRPSSPGGVRGAPRSPRRWVPVPMPGPAPQPGEGPIPQRGGPRGSPSAAAAPPSRQVAAFGAGGHLVRPGGGSPPVCPAR